MPGGVAKDADRTYSQCTLILGVPGCELCRRMQGSLSPALEPHASGAKLWGDRRKPRKNWAFRLNFEESLSRHFINFTEVNLQHR